MGIKHFFPWLCKNHANCVKTILTKDTLQQHNVVIDTLGLDLNGIFHPAAQKVFKYGQNVPQYLKQKRKTRVTQSDRLRCFQEVCNMIDELIYKVNPQKRLLLCVDGVAGVSKCMQQRSRRFKSKLETSDCPFDSCSITPGTIFMDHLTKYIDWYVKKQINDGKWPNIEVIFSNEKVPGEGEHKIKNIMRDYCDYNETFCIYGLDADLIMLCLSIDRPNVYVYRDNAFKRSERFIIDIGQMAKNLKQDLKTECAVVDFIFVCFMVGNDFLPQIPGLEIFNGGIEILLDIYRQSCPEGLIDVSKNYQIRLDALLNYFRNLAPLEIEAFKAKYLKRDKYFKDPLLEKHFRFSRSEELVECNFENFRGDYYQKKLGLNNEDCVLELGNEYIKGLQWVIHYYCVGIPNWRWYYPENYAPFLVDLAKCVNYRFEHYPQTKPLKPFQQLLSVLPPQSKNLLPNPLGDLMEHDELKDLYPIEFEVDVSGKRAEWEGIANIPILDLERVLGVYDQYEEMVDRKDKGRNTSSEAVKYYTTPYHYSYKSYYGDIEACSVKSKVLKY